MESADSKSPQSNASTVYAQFLQRRDRGDVVDLAAFCVEHPQLTEELHQIHGRQETMTRELQPSTSPDPQRLTSPPADEPPPIAPGRYTFLEKVAQGGMGVVYKVWDKNLHRELAMKLIRGKQVPGTAEPQVITDPDKLARFVREAEITATLDHPGIVPIHEMALDEHGRAFFTMRLVQGQSLDAIYKLSLEQRSSWTQTRILDVIVKICETIAFAHSKGVIHRDLKPENIMVGQFGETYVMDWGLAKFFHRISSPKGGGDVQHQISNDVSSAGQETAFGAAEEHDPDSQTIAGTVLGTAPFMPPEQAAGRVNELDERSDIYSVGAILYELLTGLRPYVSRVERYNAVRVVHAVIAGPPDAIISLNPRVAVELVSICEKAMARRKQDRYQNMREMADDLRAYLENRVVRAHQTGAVTELKKWFIRNRNTALASLIALIMSIGGLCAVVAIQMWSNYRLDNANQQISKSNLDVIQKNLQIEHEIGLKQAALEEESKARRLADAESRRSEGLLLARESTNIAPLNPGLGLLLAMESDARQPGFAANSALLAALPLHHESRTLIAHRGTVRTATFSPDGSKLVTASEDQTAIVWDVGTGEPKTWLIGHQGLVGAAKFSPDGRRIATASSDKTAAIWDAETGEMIHTLVGHENVVWCVAFSPDGQTVATASSDGTARIWNSFEGTLQSVLRSHTADVYVVEFSRDGQTLVTGSADTTIRLWDRSGTERQCLRGHIGGVSQLLFSSDDRQLLTKASWRSLERSANGSESRRLSTDKTVRLWEVRSGELLKVLEHDAVVDSASFSPVEPRIVTGSTGGSVYLWNSETGERLQRIDVVDGPIQALRFSPDGRSVVAGTDRGAIHLLNADTGKSLGQLAGHSDAVRDLDFSSTGKIVSASVDQTARVWKTRVYGRVEPLLDDPRVTRIAVSSDGSRLLMRPIASEKVAMCRIPGGDRIGLLEHDNPVIEATFSPSGSLIATLTQSGDARVFSAIDGSHLMTIDSVSKVSHLDFDGDSRLVCVSQSEGLVTVWDLSSQSALHRLPFAADHQWRSSPNHRLLLCWPKMSEDAVLWNLAAANSSTRLPQIWNSPQDLPMGLAFSPDGSRLVTSSVGHPAPRVWDTQNGRLVADLDFEGKQGVVVVFSPDGQYFAVGSSDAPASVWEARTGKLKARLIGHEGSASSVWIGANADRVVTRSADKRLRLWDGPRQQSICLLADRDDSVVRLSRQRHILTTLNAKRDKLVLWNSQTGKQIGLVSAGQNQFSDTLTSPNGEWFVTGFKDGSAQILPVMPVDFARTIATRGLTPEERELFQVGTDDQRATYRQDWIKQVVVRFLTHCTKIHVSSLEQRRAMQTITDSMLQRFLDSISPTASDAQRAAMLADVESRLPIDTSPGESQLIAMARKYAGLGDHQRSERLYRIALESGEFLEGSDWTAWAALCFRNGSSSPNQLLAEFPQTKSAAADDLRWLLERLAVREAIRINAGGGDFASNNGNKWRHDCFFRGGHLFGESFGNPQPSTAPIEGTADQPLYQTERWFDHSSPAEQRGYQIPLPRGKYRIVMHFSEIYFRPPDQRIIDVLAENQLVVSQFDTVANGFAKAEQRDFEIQIDDGQLDLEFRGAQQNPKVSAIEISRLD